MRRSELKRKFKTANNERGMITLDFAFSLFVAMCFSMVFFAISVTLSMVEITQYIAFATSRTYIGGHETPDLQRDIALAKYNEIMEYPIFKTFFGLGWVTLNEGADNNQPEIGDFSGEYPPHEKNSFVGVRIKFAAKILNLRFPLLGNTASNDKTGKADVNSYLLREPSSLECREYFNRLRFDKLKNLQAASGGSPYQAAQGSYFVITDNGC